MLGRIVIDAIRPRTPDSRHPAKATLGEKLLVSADVFADGHDVLGARVRLVPYGEGPSVVADLTEVGNDRWEALVDPPGLGPHHIVVEAWRDPWATWRHRVEAFAAAGRVPEIELAEGAALLEVAAKAKEGPASSLLEKVARSLSDTSAPYASRLEEASSELVSLAMTGPMGAGEVTSAEPVSLWVDRPLAGFSAWYELFPRSFGGFKGVAEMLPYIAEMGFDVVYLPPVHPIGKTSRKGRGGSTLASPDDPGSPWAIGSEEGGHEAIDPSLGTLEDFCSLVDAARQHGLEIALDYALQCSPDHPWVKEHPEWFRTRVDGSIAHAENPPKRYEDIVPLQFWPEDELERVALWEACLAVFETWIARGVSVFRVDNPHTKPVAFWEWVISRLRERYPDVILLSEAFTRPKMMAKLAEVGFSQSYTYFTWRNSSEELSSYAEEVTSGETADYLRPCFWPNTPDILSGVLRRGPKSAFALRLVLAATMVPNYGIYSGYELCENEPASESNEEYAFSEKYELKKRNFDDPASLAPLLSDLNSLRRRHPCLRRQAGLKSMGASNPALVAYARRTEDRSDVVVVVVNLDPFRAQSGTLSLDLEWMGVPWDRPFGAYDELSGELYTWSGENPYVALDPARSPAHVLHVRRLG